MQGGQGGTGAQQLHSIILRSNTFADKVEEFQKSEQLMMNQSFSSEDDVFPEHLKNKELGKNHKRASSSEKIFPFQKKMSDIIEQKVSGSIDDE